MRERGGPRRPVQLSECGCAEGRAIIQKEHPARCRALRTRFLMHFIIAGVRAAERQLLGLVVSDLFGTIFSTHLKMVISISLIVLLLASCSCSSVQYAQSLGVNIISLMDSNEVQEMVITKIKKHDKILGMLRFPEEL